MALFRRERHGQRPVGQQGVEERPVVVERRGPGFMTVITSVIGWVVLLIVIAILVIVFLL